jgi:hypothetical protein
MGEHKAKAISGEHRAWSLERTNARDFTLAHTIFPLDWSRAAPVRQL